METIHILLKDKTFASVSNKEFCFESCVADISDKQVLIYDIDDELIFIEQLSNIAALVRIKQS